MTWGKKNLIYVVILIIALAAVLIFRNSAALESVSIDGQTMGTTYKVTYFDNQNRNFKNSIDSLLTLVNKSINTYDSSSEVSRLNRAKGFPFESPYLYPPLKKGQEVHKLSGGAFDLTVMPLVNAWGFGPGKPLSMDSMTVDSLKAIVGFEKILLSTEWVVKTDARVQLDFGGIGQGYGADVITDFLRSKGISDMLVELGGEGMAVGKNRKTNKDWTIGILDPGSTRENQFYKVYVTLADRSFTTSGNYFNYREIDGKKYTHTIDPKTGYPAERAILSASVFAKDCITADAWATAFMVMGHEEAIEYIKSQSELDAIFMYTSSGTEVELFISDGIKSNVVIEQD